MRRFPASTTVAVLTFPSLHRIDVPDVANDDAEDTTRDIEWPLEAFASTRTVRLFISASTSSDQIFLASSEKIQMASSEQFINFPPAGISILFNENVFLHQL